MKVLPDALEFEWDKGNEDKNLVKHGVSPREAEEIFVCRDLIILPDVKHLQKEERYVAVGQALSRKYLFVVFTLRRDKIRIISSRRMHKEEEVKYAEIKKNS